MCPKSIIVYQKVLLHWSMLMIVLCLCAVLPSTGIGSLSAREAEGRTNISAGEKV